MTSLKNMKKTYQFTFTLSSKDSNLIYGNNKESFWNVFVEHFKNKEISEDSEYYLIHERIEQNLKDKCGKHLRNDLIYESSYEMRYFYRQDEKRRSIDYSNYTLYTHNVFFTVENISYSSMTMTFAIAGLTSLVKYFSNNFDSFEAFLNLYIIDCFLQSLPYTTFSKQYIHKNDIEKYYNWKINISDEIQKVFLKKSKEEEKTEKKLINSFLMANLPNFALLLPVILSLIILGFEILSLKEEKKEYQKIKTQQLEEWKKLYTESRKEVNELKRNNK